MKIVWNYIFIVTGLCMLLQICGIPIGGISQLFQTIGLSASSSGFTGLNENSGFWSFVFGPVGILIAIAGGVIIGIFTRASPENFIILPFISGELMLFSSAIFSIINYSITTGMGGGFATVITTVIILIMTPYAIALIAAFVDYFRGGDF